MEISVAESELYTFLQNVVSESEPDVYDHFIQLLQQHCQDEWRPTEVINSNRAAALTDNPIHLFACPVFMLIM